MRPPGLVAAGHEITAAAAAQVMAAGGNAFDAIVAAGFAAAVAEPTLTGLGGGGFLLAHRADGDDVLFDFFVDAPGLEGTGLDEPHFVPVTIVFPASTQDFNVGWGSVATPGVLAGYLHVHDRFGRLDLAEVLAPAIAAAHAGVELNEWQAYLFELLAPILTFSDDATAIFAAGGRLPGQGDRFRNEALAAFLESIAAGGCTGFADPSVARPLAGAAARGEGLVTEADLGSHRVVERAPLETVYRGRRVLTNPPPSFGGELLALALELLDADAPGPVAAARHVEVAAAVDRARATGEVAKRLRATRGTTHVSVADHEGNVAAMTTSNGEGAGVIAPGTGVMLNNMLGEDDLHPEGFHLAVAGTRVASMMSPTMVFEPDGSVVAIGSGGSKRIRSALCQVISAVVDEGLGLAAAVERGRIHWDGAVVQLEPGFAPEVVEALAERWDLNLWPERNLYFGGVHGVRSAVGSGADPRRGGTTLEVADR